MPFEQAKLFSSIVHYAIALSLLIFYSVYKNKGLINMALKFYIAIAVWASICIIFDGCPLTLAENLISSRLYGIPFYPDYSFDTTDIKHLLAYRPFYYPLILLLVTLAIQYINGHKYPIE